MSGEFLRDKFEQVKALGSMQNVTVWLHRNEYGRNAVEEWTIFADISGIRMHACSRDWDTALEQLRAHIPCDAETTEVLLSL